jgi:hypothetical protein
MVRENPVTMCVHPSMRRWLKMEAARRGTSIVKFSKKIAEDLEKKGDVTREFPKFGF